MIIKGKQDTKAPGLKIKVRALYIYNNIENTRWGATPNAYVGMSFPAYGLHIINLCTKMLVNKFILVLI